MADSPPLSRHTEAKRSISIGVFVNLQDLGNIGQAVAAVIAIVGIPLAVRQLVVQNRISSLDVLREIDTRWTNRLSVSNEFAKRVRPSESSGLFDTETFEIINDYLSAIELEASASGVRSVEGTGYVYLAVSVDPAAMRERYGFDRGDAPRDEKEYGRELALRCCVIHPLLDRLAAERTGDLAVLTELAMGLATVYNDIVEYFEFGLSRPDFFLQKRWMITAREVHLIEPLLMWIAKQNNTEPRSGRVLRTMSLGMAARAYAWTDQSRRDYDLYLRAYAREKLAGRGSYGPILRKPARRRLTERVGRFVLVWKAIKELRDPRHRNAERLIRLAVRPGPTCVR